MDKVQQEACRRELVESFKVFYSSLNVHLKGDISDKFKPFVDMLNEFVDFTDDVDVMVRFEYVVPKEQVKRTKFQPITEFVKQGVSLPEDVERFFCEIKVVLRKEHAVFETKDSMPFYKSETFVVKDNARSSTTRLYLDSFEQGKSKNVVVTESFRLRDLSNNRIRIGEELSVEL